MRIVESMLRSAKAGAPCLDAIFESERWVMVLDQSTPKTIDEPLLHDAARIAFEQLDGHRPSTAGAIVGHFTAAIAAATVSSNSRPCFTMAILDALGRRVVRVGDIHVVVGDQPFAGHNPVDTAAGEYRALIIEADLADQGLSNERTDAARQIAEQARSQIEPALRSARALRNSPHARFGFGAVDGTEVPADYIQEIPIGSDAVDVVLMTDGYLGPAATLADAEQHLSATLRSDPLLIRSRTTKHPNSINDSFDDRAFVRIRLAAEEDR